MKRLLVCALLLGVGCSSEQSRSGGGTTTVAGATTTTGADSGPSSSGPTDSTDGPTSTLSPGCTQVDLLVRGDGVDTPCAAVEQLQVRLVTFGAVLTIDGEFGPNTEAAVKAFQADQGLPVTGQVDPATWTALQADPTVEEMFLRHDGIGNARFTNSPGAVLDYFEVQLGRPTTDSGWVPAVSPIACISPTLRFAEWPGLVLHFAEIDGSRRWIGYEHNDTGVPGSWRTEKGLEVGDTVARLTSLYPDVEIIDDYYSTDIGLWGYIDGSTGELYSIAAGQSPCSE